MRDESGLATRRDRSGTTLLPEDILFSRKTYDRLLKKYNLGHELSTPDFCDENQLWVQREIQLRERTISYCETSTEPWKVTVVFFLHLCRAEDEGGFDVGTLSCCLLPCRSSLVVLALIKGDR